MIYNYYDYEENAPKDEFVEKEIKVLLEQINNEKRKVIADMYTEKNQMDVKIRENE